MKNTIYILSIVALSAIILQCEKETQESLPVDHVKTILGGCNGQSFDEIMLARYEEKDTLKFYIKNDTLNVFVGVNYICCAPFESGFDQSGDSLFFNITDTCPIAVGSCYCRCMCYYTFDFLLTGFEKKQYYFKIIIHDARQDEPYVFREGTVDISYK